MSFQNGSAATSASSSCQIMAFSMLPNDVLVSGARAHKVGIKMLL